MKTKTIEVCDAIHINIMCAMNDAFDMKCGGPATLGYEFNVNPDDDIQSLNEFLKKCLRKYHRPFMSVTHYIGKNILVEHLWTREMMENCIKENAVI